MRGCPNLDARLSETGTIAVVIAGLDPAIHPARKKSLRRGWTRGSSPGVTESGVCLAGLTASLSPLRVARDGSSCWRNSTLRRRSYGPGANWRVSATQPGLPSPLSESAVCDLHRQHYSDHVLAQLSY